MKTNFILACSLKNYNRYIGRAVAQKADFSFVCLDELIFNDFQNEIKNNLKFTPKQIANVEKARIKEMMSFENTIVSLHSDLVFGKDIKAIKEKYVVVFLKLNLESYSTRALFCNEKVDGKLDELVLNEINDVYSKSADIVFDASGMKDKKVIAKLSRAIKVARKKLIKLQKFEVK